MSDHDGLESVITIGWNAQSRPRSTHGTSSPREADEAAWAMLEHPPTTMGGIAALQTYAVEFAEAGYQSRGRFGQALAVRDREVGTNGGLAKGTGQRIGEAQRFKNDQGSSRPVHAGRFHFCRANEKAPAQTGAKFGVVQQSVCIRPGTTKFHPDRVPLKWGPTAGIHSASPWVFPSGRMGQCMDRSCNIANLLAISNISGGEGGIRTHDTALDRITV